MKKQINSLDLIKTFQNFFFKFNLLKLKMKVISELQGNYNEYLKFVEHCWENTTTFTSISELESNNLLIKEYYEVPNETT